MTKPVYMDYMGTRTHISDVPDDYRIGTTEEVAALFRQQAGWMHVERVTEDTDGIYLRTQLVVVRAVLSLHFWRLMVRDVVRRGRDWRIG